MTQADNRAGSRLVIGRVMHARLAPVGHEFSYPLYLYAFDLDELPELQKKYWWFGHNRIRPIAIHDRDYLASKSTGYLTHKPPPDASSIRGRLEFFLTRAGIAERPARVTLVTGARFFNYVFNPVSFFYCFSEAGELRVIVAEINNTFDERHIYILPAETASRLTPHADGPAFYHFTQPKSFHVSPFNDMQGDYSFYMGDIETQLDIRINIVKNGSEVFRSRLWGRMIRLTPRSVLKTLVQFPLSAALAMPRIVWQAAKLRYKRKLPVFTKPKPSSPLTIKPARPRLRDRAAMRAVCSVLSRVKGGRLVLTLPRGEQMFFGTGREGECAAIRVNRYKFFWRVFLEGGVGLGESYQAGEWECDDLPAFFRFLIGNFDQVNEGRFPLSRFGRWINRTRHLLNRNSIKGSRNNISRHYDSGNEFFRSFLDQSMTYSSAVYSEEFESLETAQRRKIAMILDKAVMRPGDEVLEIGSGWGSLAVETARERDCNVTSLTLSREQRSYANELINRLGLSAKARVELKDYREMQGRFDRLVSVEMLEAVGQENLDRFFAACDRLLKPDGIAVFQVITIPETRQARYLRSCDWIQKHIFPGANIPSLLSLFESIARSTGFVVESVENFPAHYARTLRTWRERFVAANRPGKELSPEDFRTWEYYFAYCEAAFECRILGLHQIVLTRPNNKRLREIDSAAEEGRGLKAAQS